MKNSYLNHLPFLHQIVLFIWIRHHPRGLFLTTLLSRNKLLIYINITQQRIHWSHSATNKKIKWKTNFSTRLNFFQHFQVNVKISHYLLKISWNLLTICYVNSVYARPLSTKTETRNYKNIRVLLKHCRSSLERFTWRHYI